MTCPKKYGRHWVPLLIMAALALCCTTLFYAVPMKSAEPVTSREQPWFSVDEGVLYFDESHYTGGPQLTLPEDIQGISVTAIADSCFRNCQDLAVIHLPQSLEAIGENAFQNCSALRGLDIPESVVFLGKGAFDGCSALEAVCISNKLQYIGTGAFEGCTRLRYVYFLGDFSEWKALCGDFSGLDTVISCENGKFYQSGDPA